MSKKPSVVFCVAVIIGVVAGFFLFPLMANRPWSPDDDTIGVPPRVVRYAACCSNCGSDGYCNPQNCYEKTWLISCAKGYVKANCQHLGVCKTD